MIAARSFAQSALRHHFLMLERWLAQLCSLLLGGLQTLILLTCFTDDDFTG